jgi:hypothetical protein
VSAGQVDGDTPFRGEPFLFKPPLLLLRDNRRVLLPLETRDVGAQRRQAETAAFGARSSDIGV